MWQVWGGNPAKFMRKLTDEEIAYISKSAENYINLAHIHAAENSKSFEEIEIERALRKKYARKDEDYDSMLGIVRETPAELILPDNVLPEKTTTRVPTTHYWFTCLWLFCRQRLILWKVKRDIIFWFCPFSRDLSYSCSIKPKSTYTVALCHICWMNNCIKKNDLHSLFSSLSLMN